MAKKKQPKLNTAEEVNQALLALGKLEININDAENRLNERIQKLKDETAIETEEDLRKYKLLHDSIKDYCNFYKTTFEKEHIKKVNFGKFGFRDNPAKVNLVGKLNSWDKVVQRAKDLYNKVYIRTDENFNKDLAIKMYDEKVLKEEDLAAIGIKISKGITFVCEPDLIRIKKLED